MRAAFFGTPPAAVPALATLATVADVALVVTRPDRPRGRSGRPMPSAVKEAALDFGLDVAQPRRASDIAADLAALDLEVAVVVAYGQLLRPDVLAATEHGFVNVHFSLLPRWRGAAPMARAILAGDEVTGVSLMVLDEGLDTGPVFATVETAIGADEDAGRLTARLAALGAGLLGTELVAYVAGDRAPVAQDDAGATVAAKVTPEEARLSPGGEAAAFVRAVRAFHPRPGAWAVVDGDRLGVAAARDASGDDVADGAVELRQGRVLAGCADGAVELLTVQPAGKSAMAAAAWMNGRRGEPGVLE